MRRDLRKGPPNGSPSTAFGPDPDKGLRTLHGALMPEGALHLMGYAPYGRAVREARSFAGDAWPRYVPARLPDTVMVQEKLPPGGRGRGAPQEPHLHGHLPASGRTSEEAVRRHRWQAHHRRDRPAGGSTRRARVLFEGLR